jgi:GntR family transcriptional repressor for pyruvate dehydrogenase complex
VLNGTAADRGLVRAKLSVDRIRPAYEQVAEQLRSLIISGSLTPGDRLPVEAEMAGIFGISRSTVREALRVLGSQGLTYAVRGATGGTFVSATDPRTVSGYLETSIGLLSGNDGITAAELLEARAVLEVPAARLAADRRSAADLEQLREIAAREKSESERGLRFEFGHRFHEVILEAAENRLLTVLTSPLFNVISTRFLGTQQSAAFRDAVDADHDEILGHLEASDGEGAARAMQAHLARLREGYEKADLLRRSADPAVTTGP